MCFAPLELGAAQSGVPKHTMKKKAAQLMEQQANAMFPCSKCQNCDTKQWPFDVNLNVTDLIWSWFDPIDRERYNPYINS